MLPTNRWSYRRRAILHERNAKLAVKSRQYELPNFADVDMSSFEGLSAQEQNDKIMHLLKDACLDKFTHDFYPFVNHENGKLKFKVGKSLFPEVKDCLSKCTSLIRPIINARQHLAQLLCDQQCGIVARAVFETINDFVNGPFCQHVDSLFSDADGSLQRLVKVSNNFQNDVIILDKTLSKIVKFDYIGGQILSLLSPEAQQVQPRRSFIPQLFKDCIEAGMKLYTTFLQEFLYNGHINSDRFCEFAIWDLSKTRTCDASHFRVIDEKHDLPFDNHFVIILDLIPPEWKKTRVSKIVQMAMHTRRMISVLDSVNKDKFMLDFISLETCDTVEEQFEIVKKASDVANSELLKKINETFDIAEFFNLLEKIIFNPCSMWINDFVVYQEEVQDENDYPDVFITHVNNYFYSVFRNNFEAMGMELVTLKLFNHSVFDKIIPNDKRLIDFLNLDIDVGDNDVQEPDENDPVIIPNGSCSEKNQGSTTSEDQNNLNDSPGKNSSNDFQEVELPLVEQVGIDFFDTVLVKCLFPPLIQEHMNRLFRLRLALGRMDFLLTKRKMDVGKKSSKIEQLFLSFSHGFVRRYLNSAFGEVAERQWKIFRDTAKKLKGVHEYTGAQKLLLRNIYTAIGLNPGQHSFSNLLNLTLKDLELYCRDELAFNEAADSFYQNYQEMRMMVFTNKSLGGMAYPIFRLHPLVKKEDFEKIPLDPRTGALAPVQNLTKGSRRSMSQVIYARKAV
ncbi:hypothetical protein FO519_003305 [Halicephalobus sp. NKZ332]|nr:hypothetical protein FO519_003305 [Halicephalobus sp. NKZ332]